jgi:hypothetical protein
LDTPEFEAAIENFLKICLAILFLKTNQRVSNSCTISLVIDGSLENLYVFDAVVPTYQISEHTAKQKLQIIL